jgi:hypothetical protein
LIEEKKKQRAALSAAAVPPPVPPEVAPVPVVVSVSNAAQPVIPPPTVPAVGSVQAQKRQMIEEKKRLREVEAAAVAKTQTAPEAAPMLPVVHGSDPSSVDTKRRRIKRPDLADDSNAAPTPVGTPLVVSNSTTVAPSPVSKTAQAPQPAATTNAAAPAPAPVSKTAQAPKPAATKNAAAPAPTKKPIAPKAPAPVPTAPAVVIETKLTASKPVVPPTASKPAPTASKPAVVAAKPSTVELASTPAPSPSPAPVVLPPSSTTTASSIDDDDDYLSFLNDDTTPVLPAGTGKVEMSAELEAELRELGLL